MRRQANRGRGGWVLIGRVRVRRRCNALAARSRSLMLAYERPPTNFYPTSQRQNTGVILQAIRASCVFLIL